MQHFHHLHFVTEKSNLYSYFLILIIEPQSESSDLCCHVFYGPDLLKVGTLQMYPLSMD